MLSLPAAITMGDPCGIGPEIVAKLAAGRGSTMRPIVVVSDAGALCRAATTYAVDLAVEVVASPGHAAGALARGALAVIEPCAPLPADLPLGRVDPRGGAAAFAYLTRAIDLALGGDVAAIVTAPLNKEALVKAGVDRPEIPRSSPTDRACRTSR